MNYVFDFDGTLCTKVSDGDYTKAEPLVDRIEYVNSLYEQGHYIKIYTARGMGRNNDNAIMAQAEMMGILNSQIKEWGIKCHQIIMGKPSGDIYVDDKGVNADEFFSN